MRMALVLPMVFLMFFMIVLLLVFQNTVNYVGTSMGTSDWSTLRPMTQTAVYEHEGDFSVSFRTRTQDPITIKSVEVKDVAGDDSCELSYDVAGLNVEPSASFDVRAKCPYKTEGEVFSLLITIRYLPFNGFASDEVVEEGRIMGNTI